MIELYIEVSLTEQILTHLLFTSLINYRLGTMSGLLEFTSSERIYDLRLGLSETY